MTYNIELIIAVTVEAQTREEAEDKALNEISNNYGDYICHESITPPVPETIDFTRVNSDSNGNPRYVCHYLNFITDKDREQGNNTYEIALKRAKKLGGGKFHNKQYGGGIVFQSYNIKDEEKRIFELMEQYK